jgi:hypothetical protein
MGLLIATAILVLDAVAIVDIIKSGKDAEKKMLWSALIVLLPFLGMLVYFLAGKKE